MNGLSCGEESMTIYSAVLIGYQRVTDGRTDGRTDRRQAYSYYVLQQPTHVKTDIRYSRVKIYDLWANLKKIARKRFMIFLVDYYWVLRATYQKLDKTVPPQSV